MSIARDIERDSLDATQAFVNAVMTGEKSSVHAWQDVHDYPFFTFRDGSIMEFKLAYKREVKWVRCYESFEDYEDTMKIV